MRYIVYSETELFKMLVGFIKLVKNVVRNNYYLLVMALERFSAYAEVAMDLEGNVNRLAFGK